MSTKRSWVYKSFEDSIEDSPPTLSIILDMRRLAEEPSPKLGCHDEVRFPDHVSMSKIQQHHETNNAIEMNEEEFSEQEQYTRTPIPIEELLTATPPNAISRKIPKKQEKTELAKKVKRAKRTSRKQKLREKKTEGPLAYKTLFVKKSSLMYHAGIWMCKRYYSKDETESQIPEDQAALACSKKEFWMIIMLLGFHKFPQKDSENARLKGLEDKILETGTSKNPDEAEVQAETEVVARKEFATQSLKHILDPEQRFFKK